MGVAQDQQVPRITGNRQATCNRAWGIATIFVVHIVLIVTCRQDSGIVNINLIVTLWRHAIYPARKVQP